MYRSEIKPKFREAVDKLKILFPTGYEFIKEIINGEYFGFWLSSSTNAHLYYKNAYFLYLEPDINKIIIRKEFHQRIHENTKDFSNKIFDKPIEKIIEDLNGFNEGWAVRNGDTIELRSKTPELFFEELLELIKSKY